MKTSGSCSEWQESVLLCRFCKIKLFWLWILGALLACLGKQCWLNWTGLLGLDLGSKFWRVLAACLISCWFWGPATKYFILKITFYFRDSFFLHLKKCFGNYLTIFLPPAVQTPPLMSAPFPLRSAFLGPPEKNSWWWKHVFYISAVRASFNIQGSLAVSWEWCKSPSPGSQAEGQGDLGSNWQNVLYWNIAVFSPSINTVIKQE